MSNFIIIALFVCQQVFASSSYKLDTQYSGSSFFDGFTFFDIPDYSHGFVNYVNRVTATQNGLISTAANGAVYMGVDSTTVLNPNTGPGRSSVRITSKKSWTHGLFILDLAHMPGTDCGSWPAFWMVGPNWPNGGEIDIIEGVNSNTVNQVSLHTNDSCTLSPPPNTELGTLINPICAKSQSTGCGVLGTASTYGTPFNARSGGIYATEWTSAYIRVYYFPRNAIPADITSGKPNPANWGLPQANMMGNCDIDKHFYSHQIVFDTTFCGDWAGSVWQWDSVCAVKAPNCQTYVAANPGAFVDAHWMINSLKIYTSIPATSSTSKATATSTSKSSLKSTSTSSPVRKSSGSTFVKTSSTTHKVSSSSTLNPASSSKFTSKTPSVSTTAGSKPTTQVAAVILTTSSPRPSSSTYVLPKIFFKRDISSVVPAGSIGAVVGNVSSSLLSGASGTSTGTGTVSLSSGVSTVAGRSNLASVVPAPTTSVKSGGATLGVLDWLVVSVGVVVSGLWLF